MVPLYDYNPRSRFPIVTVVIIALNVVIYAVQFLAKMQLGNEAYFADVLLRYATVPQEILSLQDLGDPNLIPPPLTILSGMFMHGGVLHLAGNMLFLWVFGDNIEDRLGRIGFIVFYLGCGTAAALSQVWVSGLAAHFGNPELAEARLFMPMLGASGAIAGVLGAYLLLFPNVRVRTLVFLGYFIRMVDIPAKWLLGLWFAIQILSGLLVGGPGVAWWAHIGGFAAGLASIFVVNRIRSRASRARG